MKCGNPKKGNLPLSKELTATIEAHVKTVPIAREKG